MPQPTDLISTQAARGAYPSATGTIEPPAGYRLSRSFPEGGVAEPSSGFLAHRFEPLPGNAGAPVVYSVQGTDFSHAGSSQSARMFGRKQYESGAADRIREALADDVNNADVSAIHLTGHSQGGAVAQMLHNDVLNATNTDKVTSRSINGFGAKEAIETFGLDNKAIHPSLANQTERVSVAVRIGGADRPYHDWVSGLGSDVGRTRVALITGELVIENTPGSPGGALKLVLSIGEERVVVDGDTSSIRAAVHSSDTMELIADRAATVLENAAVTIVPVNGFFTPLLLWNAKQVPLTSPSLLDVPLLGTGEDAAGDDGLKPFLDSRRAALGAGTVTLGSATDTLTGDASDDVLFGGAGDDAMFGEGPGAGGRPASPTEPKASAGPPAAGGDGTAEDEPGDRDGNGTGEDDDDPASGPSSADVAALLGGVAGMLAAHLAGGGLGGAIAGGATNAFVTSLTQILADAASGNADLSVALDGSLGDLAGGVAGGAGGAAIGYAFGVLGEALDLDPGMTQVVGFVGRAALGEALAEAGLGGLAQSLGLPSFGAMGEAFAGFAPAADLAVDFGFGLGADVTSAAFDSGLGSLGGTAGAMPVVSAIVSIALGADPAAAAAQAAGSLLGQWLIPVPGLGAMVGGLVGTMLAGALGGSYDPPQAGTDIVVAADGFAAGADYSDFGGDVTVSHALAAQVAAGLNELLELTGGEIANLSEFSGRGGLAIGFTGPEFTFEGKVMDGGVIVAHAEDGREVLGPRDVMDIGPGGEAGHELIGYTRVAAEGRDAGSVIEQAILGVARELVVEGGDPWAVAAANDNRKIGRRAG